MNNTSNTLEAQAHVADSRLRRKRAWRLFWGMIAAFSLLLLAIPAVGYLIWQAHGRQLLRDEIAEIVRAGEPLTTAELFAWHAVPVGERDLTPQWLAALRAFSDDNLDTRYLTVPIIGTAKEPPLDQPWTDPDAVAAFLADYADELTALHAAARESGIVRYPQNYKAGAASEMFVIMSARRVTRALSVELHQHIRQRDVEAALETLDTQFALIATLEQEPYMISLLVRIAIQAVVLSDVQKLVETLPLSDEQLARLQSKVRAMRAEDQFPTAMLSERAYIYHAFHYHLDADGDPYAGQEQLEFETTHDVSRIRRPEDCAATLALYAELIAASRKPMPAALDEASRMEDSARERYSTDFVSRYRYRHTLTLLPGTRAICAAVAQSIALRDLTDTWLALHRYQLKHGQLPETLDQLVPEFLPKPPVDPFDARALRYLRDKKLLYSIGRDRKDDGGLMNVETWQPDLVRELKPLPQ